MHRAKIDKGLILDHDWCRRNNGVEVLMDRSRKILLLWCALSFFSVVSLNAQIINGGFESGDFSPGWTATTGAPGGFAVTGTFGGQAPAEGSFQAVLSSPIKSGTVAQLSLENFLSLNPGTLNSLNGPADFLQHQGGSAFRQTFTVQDGQFITFSWDFMPNGTDGSAQENDKVFFTLHDTSALSSSFTVLDMTSNHPTGTPSGYLVFTSGPLTAGTYLLGFALYDLEFGTTDSQDGNLLIDNVQLIPEPSTWALFAFGGLVAFVLARRRFA